MYINICACFIDVNHQIFVKHDDSINVMTINILHSGYKVNCDSFMINYQIVFYQLCIHTPYFSGTINHLPYVEKINFLLPFFSM